MNKLISKVLIAVFVTILMGIVFCVPIMRHVSADCHSLTASYSNCPLSTVLTDWKAAATVEMLTLLLVCVILSGRVARSHPVVFVRELSYRLAPKDKPDKYAYFQELFSQGILNPKLFSSLS